MALVVADRVQETTSTTGTSDYVLIGAATGYQSFGSVMANADATYYAVTNDTDWEVGIGTYSTTGPTLARTTILASSNGGSAVSWGVGVKNIFISYAASKSVYLDANGDLLVSDRIVHTGDTNTAIRFPAADTVAIDTGGTERFKVENSTITTTVPIVLPADPTLPLQAATKEYVDTLVASGIHFHQPVRVESPINLNATYNNGTAGVGATLTNAGTQAALVIDGVTVATNDRVLVYQQTTQTQNGVYVVTSTGSGSTNWVLTRSADTDSYVINDANGLSEGSTVFVQQGTTGAGETYTCNTSGVITFGTTNITFAQISSAQIYSAGSGLALTGTVFSNTAPDQTVTLTQGGATTITGTYPNFTISSVNTTYTAGGGIGLTTTEFSVAAGSGLTQDADGLSHADTSSQASVDNTGATFIQDVNLDTFGHVTGLASVTVTPSLIGAPSTTGVGASGSWGISVTGTAANVTGTVAVGNGGTGATTDSQARTNLGLAIGSNVQAYDAGLQSISGLTTSANQMIYTTASDTYATTSLTAAGRAILDDADAAAQRTTLGLGTIATQAASSVSITGGSISGITDLAIADGGTGASDAGTARTNLNVPTRTGGDASGTWGINVTGNAATATTAGTITSQANSATITASTAANGNQIVLRDGNADDYRRYGFAEYFNMSHGVSGATGDTIFYSSTDNYIRKNNATGLRASLNVPTRTGGDASGDWNIQAIRVTSPDGDRIASNKLPTSNPRSVRFDFATAGSVGTAGNYAGVMTYAPWDGTSASTGDSSYQLAFGNASGVNASGPATLWLRNGINSTWNSWQIILNTANVAIDVQEFTSSGTWTKPSNAIYSEILVVGGGQGGGYGRAQSMCVTPVVGYGGNGGGAQRGSIRASSLTSTVAVTVGGGGAITTSVGGFGASGGTSSFGGYMSATGGGTSAPGVGSGTGTEISGYWRGGNDASGGGSHIGRGAINSAVTPTSGGGGGGGQNTGAASAGAAGYVCITTYYVG